MSLAAELRPARQRVLAEARFWQRASRWAACLALVTGWVFAWMVLISLAWLTASWIRIYLRMLLASMAADCR